MAGALDGIRVLDLTSGPAGGLATMVLADFGAEVLGVERPGEDPLAELPAAPMWRRGKRLCLLDLDADDDIASFHALCAGADVLVCNWRSSALTRRNLHFDALHGRHPHLVFCHITGFGSHGPHADYPGYEHIVAARTGRMQIFAGIVDREGPVFSSLQVGVHACAQSAVSGILAALLERGDDGAGRLVETSMLQGMLVYEQGAMLGQQFRERDPDLPVILQSTTHEPPLPSLFYHPAQAGNGRWMQFGNLLPHLFDNFLIATDLIDIVTDPDFDPKQLALPEAKHEAFRDRMLKRIQDRSSTDWMADFVADGGIVAAPYETTQEALDNPDVVANGHVVPLDGGGVQLGPVARLVKTPAAPGRAAFADSDIVQRWQDSPRPRPGRAARTDLPLSGVRVVEIATIIAAPLGASLLADMGADVVKVEQIGGDPYRGLGAGIGSARVNAGKRSVSVNLKSDAGRDAVLALLKKADVVIHNYRPGVPERLGIGFEQVRAVNPSIVYLQCNGYGPDGPGANRPSTHPIPGAAMGGVLYQMGERVPSELQDIAGLRLWTRRLMRANEVNPDPNTAVVIAASAMLGLVARQRQGEGQQILVDMFGANAYANHDDFLRYPGKRPRAMPDDQLMGLSATYRLYRCADDHWVFLALTRERERRRFIELLTARDIEAPSPELLAAGGDRVADALATLFASHPASWWEAALAPYGVGCVRADGAPPSEFWLEDPQADALGLTVPAEHPFWGSYRRHGPMVVFDHRVRDLKPPPLAGEHNLELLTELGYTADDVAARDAEGIIWAERQGD